MMKHELLAPAGSPETLRAVIAAGADAVYLGGNRYGARAYAQNFTDEQVLEALDYAHLRGKKIFLTVNTLLKNRETGQTLCDYLLPFYRNGLDAVIVQDFGVLNLVHERFPDLPVHASTQMSAADTYGAAWLQKAGASRIIPARELSLAEIRSIHEKTGAELECFVHGALCFCYSGQCLMSSLLGGRSGNRGRCAQPCRFPYQVTDENGKSLRPEDRFPLSLKDLCALPLLPDLCEAGVYSFKIEGRMKSAEYAGGVTEIYRKYLDLYERDPENYKIEPEDYNRLLALGNRKGFTEGYYRQHGGRSMVTMDNPFHTGVEAGEKLSLPSPQILPVSGTVRIRAGMPARLTLRCEAAPPASLPENAESAAGENRAESLSLGHLPETSCGYHSAEAESAGKKVLYSRGKTEAAGKNSASVTVEGDPVLPAENRPLTEEDIRKRIEKCGNTAFYFTSLEVDLEGDCFVPVSRLNDLRRNGLQALQEALLKDFRRTDPETKETDSDPLLQHGTESARGGETAAKTDIFLDVQVSTLEQFREALRHPAADQISLDLAADVLPEYRKSGKRPGSGTRFAAQTGAFYAELLKDCLRHIRRAGKSACFCFPPVFRAETSSCYQEAGIAEIIKKFDCVRARNYDSLGFALDVLRLDPEKIRLDHSLYVCSTEACRAFGRFGLRHYTASAELTQGELGHMPNADAEMPVYGRAAMMVTAQCLLKNEDGCARKGDADRQVFLKDRKSKSLYVQRNCLDCYNVIYNSEPLCLLHQAPAVKKLGFGSLRVSFVDERQEQVKKILDDYQAAFRNGKKIPVPSGITTGHFRKGVE